MKPKDKKGKSWHEEERIVTRRTLLRLKKVLR
jgi:hypothetical protein